MTSAPRRALGRLARVAAVALALTLAAPTAASAYEAGVDTSHYQHAPSLDWSKVKADGVDFAFLKATEGSSYTDPYFAADWAATTKLGIYRGAYHFARPSVGSAEAQASYFISRAGKAASSGDLPPALDLEVTGGLSKSQLTTWVSNFLLKVKALTGRTPIIYCSPSFWETHVGSTAFGGYPLWIAHYTSASQPWIPKGWSRWTFWQNTSSGRVSGISGNVDKDRFNGTLADLKVLARVTGAPTPPPPPPPAPAVATRTSLASSQPEVVAGGTVSFSGTVTTTTSPATGAAGQTVALARRLPGTTDWVRVKTGVTDATGAYNIAVPVDQTADYRSHALGNTAYTGSFSPIVRATVVPPVQTVTTLAASAPSVLAGGTVTFTGAVTTTDTPARPLPGRTVALARRVAGTTSWIRVTTAVTDADGSFSFSPVVDQAASYRVHDLPDPTYLQSTSPAVPVALIQPTTVTATPDAPGAYAGGKVTITGAVTSVDPVTPLADRPIQLSRRAAGSTTWQPVADTVTDASGGFALPVVVDQTAAYRVRTAGDAVYAASTSKAVSVALIPPARTYLDIHADHPSVRKGRTFRLFGHLRGRAADGSVDAVPGRWVSLWRHPVGSTTWQRCGGYRTSVSGWWRVRTTIRQDMVYQARFGGGTRFAPVSSPRLRMRITTG